MLNKLRRLRDCTSFSQDCISHHTLLEKSWYLVRMSLSWSDCKVTLIENLAGAQNRGDVAKFSLAEWQQLKNLALSHVTYCLAWSNVFFFTMPPWSHLVPKIHFSWALNKQSLLLFISQPTNDSNVDDLGLPSLWETIRCPHSGCMRWDAAFLDHSCGTVHRRCFFMWMRRKLRNQPASTWGPTAQDV